MVNYDGRTFRVSGEDGEDAADVPQARYHQDGNVVWGEFAGGHVRRGSLAGTCSPDGVLGFAYCMVYDSGEVVSGRCRSTPQLLDDGRIRLNEEWERYTPHTDRGVSYLDEVYRCAPPSAVGQVSSKEEKKRSHEGVADAADLDERSCISGAGVCTLQLSEGGADRPPVTTTSGDSDDQA